MMELVERFIKAVEKIAVAMNIIANVMADGGTVRGAVKEIAESDKALDEETGAPNYAAMAEQGKPGYKMLLGLCEKRGITVKARTKGLTIAKMLEAWDLAHPSGKPTDDGGPAAGGEGTTGEDPDPFADNDSTEDPDPFADDGGGGGEDDKVYTEVEVREALQALMKSKDNPEEGKKLVIKALDDAAGVKTLKDLPKEEYSSLMKAIG